MLDHGRGAVSRSLTQAPVSLYLLVIAGLIALQAVALYALGQPPIPA